MTAYSTVEGVSLRILSGPSEGWTIPIPKDGLALGRSGAFASDKRISAKHADVLWDSQNQLYVRDLDSTNGTFVNGTRIKEWGLDLGDQIRIGSTVLQVSAPDAAAGPPQTIQGGQSAIEGGANVRGSNYGVIDTRREEHNWDVVFEDELSWWTRARGLARIVVIIGLVLGLAGFGSFGYGVFSGMGGSDALRQAEAQCRQKYPEIGQQQIDCLFKAEQGPAAEFKLSPFIQVGAGLAFAGIVLMTVARILPGARPQQTRRPRR